MTNVLVLEGSRDTVRINTCRYALLKYLEVYNLNPPPAIAVYVYTDQPALFESFIPFIDHFEIKEVSETQFKQWHGSPGFPQRVKMKILEEVLEHINGNVLYLDTDTCIQNSLEPHFASIENGAFLLHSCKGNLNEDSEPAARRLKKFLADSSIKQNDNAISTSGMKLWNTCCIGINSKFKTLLDDVLELTDIAGSQFSAPVWESFAFSYCFQKAGNIQACKDSIYHYKNLKEFRKLLQLFFRKNEEESIPNLVKGLRHLDVATIQKQKSLYEALPLYKKWLQALKGKSWSIKQYEKKI